ncbi:unnamed protein product [Rotaria socialis]|uniref:VLIG-type G domain-containing protein n=1 Tax=Rotaria socialis TaxID=392032 RepID=A0A820JAP1_9BILA|nr:unnamed protein product [Rotaria socialis]CAF3564746.1 unnamed protein product [Rotaria socialis]CAF4168030.1 unnamed protein product [Rotaria socialis]CAF4323841.1 unnamed protein product [Rotaria socialis]
MSRILEDDADYQLNQDLLILHKIVNVKEHGHAYKASLCDGDCLIEINGHDVRSRSYVECVTLLQNTGDKLTIKVIRCSEENTVVSSTVQTSIVDDTVQPSGEERISSINIVDFLKPDRCIYSIKVNYNDSSIVRCFDFLKPYCTNPDGPLHPTFNTIVDQPLDTTTLSQILNNRVVPADALTVYVVDSLKRYHALNDIITLLSNDLYSLLKANTINECASLIEQLTKRVLLVQTLENMPYDSQRFLCNFIRKNDLPIPLSYRIWDSTEKTMYHRINFNCLMEVLCLTDLHAILQFGSPSASGLGKTSLIGYFCHDKRLESLFTDASDMSWRDGCMDVLFTDRFTVFDVHGTATDIRLIRSIQPYTYVQIIYVTEADLNTNFLEENAMANAPHISTIVVIFDRNYDNHELSMKLIKSFEEKFKHWTNTQWASAPMVNTSNNLSAIKKKIRNQQLYETFDHLLKQIKPYGQEPLFRSCFQIQSSFYETNAGLAPIKLVFDIEKKLHRLFSNLSDTTENLRLVTPHTYQQSIARVPNASLPELLPSETITLNYSSNDISQRIPTSCILNEYHAFTILLLNDRTYIELLIVDAYLEKWRAAYAPNLRQTQLKFREKVSKALRQLKQAERENVTSSEITSLRENYESLLNQLKEVDIRLANVDLTFGLLCDELFSLWDTIHRTQSSNEIKKYQKEFDLVATKLTELVYKGFALHILRGRPLKSHSRLLKMCIEKLTSRESVAVLTVVGEQSSGKSSLLNSTFGCNFRVSTGRCTLGLYLGLAYYKNMAIIIIDSEGLMSLEESGSIFDNQMVTMAILSSNVVIVNHKGELGASLEGLIGMSLYAKIQIQSSPIKPALLFVLRDQNDRNMDIFQQQLGTFKDNIQTNGKFLQICIDDELDMANIVLLPGAYTEDINSDYGKVKQWRTEKFSREINEFRKTVFKCLEEHIQETVNTKDIQHNSSDATILRKYFDTYLYSKLTTNWKSIDDLGVGLLQCQNLYELSIQNELRSIAGNIIVERQNRLQRIGSDLIQTLIKNNDQCMHTNLNTNTSLELHCWVKNIVKNGNIELNKVIDEQVEGALKDYHEQTQHSYFAKMKSHEATIEASIKNIRQYLYEQLETRALEMALKMRQDYYRRELFDIKVKSEQFNDLTTKLNQRVQQLEIEITDSLQAYRRSKEAIAKSVLDVYRNLSETKSPKKHRNSAYNLCQSLDYNKYVETIKEFDNIINRYMKSYIENNGRFHLSQETATPQSPFPLAEPIFPSSHPLEDLNVYKWFNNIDDLNKKQQTMHFVFRVLLSRINDRLEIFPLHLVYSDPKMVNELIETIDDEINSAKIDLTHINRTVLVHDLIILILYMLVEKTNQRFEFKINLLLSDTLNDLNQVKQNLLDQINKDETSNSQAQLFRRIVGKEIIHQVKRINRQNLIEEILTKFNEYCLIHPTDITRQIYAESIASEPINPSAILKLVADPSYFCFELIYLIIKRFSQQNIDLYWNDVASAYATYMAMIRDIILSDKCTDTHVLHNKILQQIVFEIPDFQASRTIELERKIADPDHFQEYFKDLDLFQSENDSVLLQQLAKVSEDFSQTLSPECFETLIYRSIGCTSRCPGCGIKCELPAKIDFSEEHHHYSQHHLPMAFNGWPRDDQFHPHLSMCYQQWKTKTLFRGDTAMSSPEEFFSSEASDWLEDVKKKSETGEARLERYPLLEQRRAWMAVRYKLLKDFQLQDQESYHTGVYPTSIVSVPNDVEVVWNQL